MTIRRAVPRDAEAIASVHIASWLSTYSTLMPAREIAERTRWERRLALWVDWLATGRLAYIALDGAELVGFASACTMAEYPPDREPLPQFDSYLRALYLLADRQRGGLGRALLASVAREMIGEGATSLALHVLATNPARSFYEHLGATFVRDEPQLPGETWTTCAYAFEEIGVLVAGA